MTKSNIFRFQASYNSEEDEAAGLLPAAEVSLTYRRLPYDGLLATEESFVVLPMNRMLQFGRDKYEESEKAT